MKDLIELRRRGLEPEQIAERLSRTDPWSYTTMAQRIALENMVRYSIGSDTERQRVSMARKAVSTHRHLDTQGCRTLILWDRAVRLNLEQP